MPAQSHETLTQDLLSGILAMVEQTESEAKAAEPPAIPPSAFQPRDPLESVLAELAAAHVRLILKSVTEVLATPPGAARAKGQAQLVSLDRMLLGFLRELRIARKRPDDTLARSQDEPAPPRQAAAVPARTAPPPARVRTDGAEPAVVHRPSRPSHRGALLSGASSLASAALQPPRMPAP